MLALRAKGWLNVEIAEVEGVSTHAVAQRLSRRRVARFPELTWVPSPYWRPSLRNLP